jgi:hypothetical protein
MGAKTGSIFFQKEPEQERSAKEKVKTECTYKLLGGGGVGGLEVKCIQLALQAKFAAAKSSSRSSSDSPKNKNENMKIPVILARNSVYDCK